REASAVDQECERPEHGIANVLRRCSIFTAVFPVWLLVPARMRTLVLRGRATALMVPRSALDGPPVQSWLGGTTTRAFVHVRRCRTGGGGSGDPAGDGRFACGMTPQTAAGACAPIGAQGLRGQLRSP